MPVFKSSNLLFVKFESCVLPFINNPLSELKIRESNTLIFELLLHVMKVLASEPHDFSNFNSPLLKPQSLPHIRRACRQMVSGDIK